MEQELVNMLKASAEADRQKALLTLKLLSQHPAGIGDHSTKDFYENAEEALQMLVDADDRLGALERHFPLEKHHPNGTADSATAGNGRMSRV